MLADSDFGAVVFDLYDTLIVVAPEARVAHKQGLARRMGLGFGEFDTLWDESSPDSNLGRTGVTEQRFAWVGERAGVTTSPDLLTELAETEHRFLRESVRVVDGVPDLLRDLRAAGIGVWLLSNCSPSVEHTLDASGLRPLRDGQTLSCDVGFVKPDAGIYQHALAALGQPAQRVLYVADGMVSELSAARALGMPAARVTWSHSRGELPDGVPSAASVTELRRLIAAPADSGRAPASS